MPKSLDKMIQPNVFMVPADKATAIARYLKLETEDLLQQLVPIIKQFAIPPISKYQVGVVALGKSGNIYLGVNLEFLGAQLNGAVHAEHFAIINARNHGETEITAMAFSAAPCGHCRQFLNEIGSDIRVLTLNYPPTTLSALLPNPFGPKDLGLSGNLLSPVEKIIIPEQCSMLKRKAMEALHASYAPYSHSPSGVAIRTTHGNIYQGSYLENAAYNPSISPLQAALVAMVADLKPYSEIYEVILLEKDTSKVNHGVEAKAILAKIAPNAMFISETLDDKKPSVKMLAKM